MDEWEIVTLILIGVLASVALVSVMPLAVVAAVLVLACVVGQ